MGIWGYDLILFLNLSNTGSMVTWPLLLPRNSYWTRTLTCLPVLHLPTIFNRFFKLNCQSVSLLPDSQQMYETWTSPLNLLPPLQRFSKTHLCFILILTLLLYGVIILSQHIWNIFIFKMWSSSGWIIPYFYLANIYRDKLQEIWCKNCQTLKQNNLKEFF